MTICIIPARGGSRRIPGKNIKMFHGKPIIQYSIETAKRSNLFDPGDIWVSTDSAAVAELAYPAGANVIFRPDELAKDDVGTQEVMRHALIKLGRPADEIACCLYATAPMLDVNALVTAAMDANTKGCTYVISCNAHIQDAGQFYIGQAGYFMDGMPLDGPRTIWAPQPDDRVCDINTMDDWVRAEGLYAKLREEGRL